MAVDYFLKIDGVDGESLDNKHKNEIEILSWSWGETNAGTFAGTEGGGAGRVDMQDFSFQMSAGKASPKLLLACARGDHIKEALLTCRRAGKEQQEYLKIKFLELLVSSYSTGGGSGQEVPVDSITLNFNKIEYSYAPQKGDGSLGTPIPVHYDQKARKGG